MTRENVLKSLKINFATAIFAALMAIAAFETGYITKGALAMLLTESDIYYIEVAGIMLTIAIIPAALKLFSRAMSKAVKNEVEKGLFIKLFYKRSLTRIMLLFIPLVANIFIYYGVKYDGAMYCAILSLGALIYSYPTGKVLDDYTNGNK